MTSLSQALNKFIINCTQNCAITSTNNSTFISQSFKYKATLEGKAEDESNGNSFAKKITKILVSLKYLSKFGRSL